MFTSRWMVFFFDLAAVGDVLVFDFLASVVT
jgi:hypothetical protein